MWTSKEQLEKHAIEFTEQEVREALEDKFECKIPSNSYMGRPIHYMDGTRFWWDFDIK